MNTMTTTYSAFLQALDLLENDVRIDRRPMHLQVRENVYLDGFYCQQAGSVDWEAHYYRIGRAIVRTDDQGFRVLYRFATVDDATLVMDLVCDAYSQYLGGDDL